MTLFDRYVVVDWSAAARPKTGPDSIWIAVVGSKGDPVFSNPPTRAGAAAMLRSVVDGTERVRTLLAVDASLGYPYGSAAWCRLPGQPPWRAWWDALTDAIVDEDDNRNNRFEVAADLNRRGGGTGPFWGRPRARDLPHLTATKPPTFPVAEFRLTELRLRELGFRPASCWQLLGAGSVGSQTLTLLPVLRGLLARPRLEVWPFTTGLSAPEVDPGVTIVVETWPTAFEIDRASHPVRDAAQVAGVALRLRESDAAGDLSGWFSPALGGVSRARVEMEEGWVLAPG